MHYRIWDHSLMQVGMGMLVVSGYAFQERRVAGALVPERWFFGDHICIMAGPGPGARGDIVRWPAAGEGLAGDRHGNARGHLHLGDCLGADQTARGPFALFERFSEDLRLVPERRAREEVDEAGGLVFRGVPYRNVSRNMPGLFEKGAGGNGRVQAEGAGGCKRCRAGRKDRWGERRILSRPACCSERCRTSPALQLLLYERMVQATWHEATRRLSPFRDPTHRFQRGLAQPRQ